MILTIMVVLAFASGVYCIGLYHGMEYANNKAVEVIKDNFPAKANRPTRIYLAIPYSKVDRELSYKIANRVTAELTRAGHHVFSPISMSHGLTNLPKDWTFWEELDKSFIEWADELHVIPMDGWEESEGVQAEIKIAQALGKTVKYVSLLGGGNSVKNKWFDTVLKAGETNMVSRRFFLFLKYQLLEKSERTVTFNGKTYYAGMLSFTTFRRTFLGW